VIFLMKKVLMCHPRYYQVKFQLNPWMNPKQSVNLPVAVYQWQKLKRLIENFLNLKTVSVKPRKNLPDLVFSTDAGIVYHQTFVQANFYYQQRKKEVEIYKRYFKKRNYKIYQLFKSNTFEGGDFLFWHDKILAGWGFRTAKKAHQKLANFFGKKLISLKLINPYFYHLDTALCILDEKTAAFYPQAFDRNSCLLIKKIFPRLIKAKKEEAFNFCLNALVYQKKIITSKGLSGLADEFKSLGFQTKEIDVSEFKKACSGVHCLTKLLN